MFPPDDNHPLSSLLAQSILSIIPQTITTKNFDLMVIQRIAEKIKSTQKLSDTVFIRLVDI